ncbi:MAG: DUF4128 domain-containing protein [Pseudomonadota bacterium]
MPTFAEALIHDLLMARVATFSNTPALPVAYPNVDFIPPASGDWLEVAYLPNTNVDLYLANDDETLHRGLMQITLVSARGRGGSAPLDLAGKIASHFAKGTTLYGSSFKVRVPDKPSVSAPLQDPPYLRTPVTVRWQAFV